MNNIRLLPVVVVAVSALLLLKTLGLATSGGYVLGGIEQAQAASGAPAAPAAEHGEGSLALPGEPTIEDTSPTIVDGSPTLAPAEAEGGGGGHGAPAAAEGEHGEAAGEKPGDSAVEGHDTAGTAEGAAHAVGSGTYCIESDAAIGADGTVVMNPASAAATHGEGQAEAAAVEDEVAADNAASHGSAPSEGASQASSEFAASMTDCLPSGDAVPVQLDGKGGATPLIDTNVSSLSQQQLLERLAARRTELEKYEQDLALRSSIVDAAEKRIEERTATLQALEAQIATLVDQRTEMETGQFAGIVAMYETMKPKDAAAIFNNLDMEVLLRVAKTMSPRKMAPILAVMDTARAQELTVKMAALADKPATEMTADDLAALPQIVGQ